MEGPPQMWVRFSLRSLMILILGIAIGFALNQPSFQNWVTSLNQTHVESSTKHVIEPPDILKIDVDGAFTAANPTVAGLHPIGPDGTVNLGGFGHVFVTGMTIDQARAAIKQALSTQVSLSRLRVDLIQVDLHDKQYSILRINTNGIKNVRSFPLTGNETVLDAVAQVGGHSKGSDTTILLIRSVEGNSGTKTVIPVEWNDTSSGNAMSTNPLLMPNDRIVISN